MPYGWQSAYLLHAKFGLGRGRGNKNMDKNNPKEITDQELAYFMGRVDTQLTQILDMLKAQQSDLKKVSRLEQENQGLLYRVGEIEDWKDKVGDSDNVVTFRWVREKLQVPLILAILVFLLTTIIPAIVNVKTFLGW